MYYLGNGVTMVTPIYLCIILLLGLVSEALVIPHIACLSLVLLWSTDPFGGPHIFQVEARVLLPAPSPRVIDQGGRRGSCFHSYSKLMNCSWIFLTMFPIKTFGGLRARICHVWLSIKHILFSAFV
ncbi:unnamed protein product [Cuscuta epithymum]|uniref:Uncharacterized protein n=1 Tax=Cuscuta epithymum TaxID=186058 RepID=A0AAV0ELM5_9ASTE|nr:unnamed protein product [Cuscuta epithymum]